MNKKKDLKIVTLTMNLAIIIFEIIGFVIVFKDNGFKLFEYYTQDSNLLLLVSSIMISIYMIKSLKGNKVKVPKWFSAFRLTAVLSVLVTFFTVVFFLMPTFGGPKEALIDGSMKYHHLLCPILATLSFIFYEKYEIKKYDNIKSLIFTVLYSVVLILLNILKVVDGPYPFLRVTSQSLIKSVGVSVAMLVGAIAISYLLVILNKKLCVKKVETLK